MTKKLSRRDFLKITGTGAAAGMVLVGCGPTSRYVRRQPYAEMPEYQQVGKSTYYATSCRECAAGCGLIVRTFEGRAIKIEGNPNHPVNRGKICPRGLTAVQGVYNLDRITGPKDQGRRGTNDGKDLSWDDGLKIVKKALSENNNGETAFLLGAAPDHLYDFVNELAPQLKTQTPVRYNTLNLLDARETWRQAVKASFGVEALPYFDIANADVIFSFGAEFLEAWLSPMAYSRGYAGMR
ncbi:MAG: twin-arginine translocation signal domain-containing protein, partial [Anaerolineaceae bacterium]|nr:twin-arginine translocation signal domain-containing protein [Anaerolineaceae bacterium]